MTKRKFFSKRNIIIFIILAVIIFVAVGFLANRGGKKTTYVTDKAVIENLTQTVSEVGTVESPTQINLSFSNPGTMQTKLVAIGDKVKSGQILAQLDLQGLTFQRDQAAATLASAQANLAKLLRGATAAQLAVAQAQVNQANSSYAAAVDSLSKTNLTVAEDTKQAQSNLNDLQGLTANITTYQQAVISSRGNLLSDISGKLSLAPTALDSINTIVTDDNIKDSLSSKDKTYLASTKIDYADAQTLLAKANNTLMMAENSQDKVGVSQAVTDSLACLKKISDALNDMYSALVNGSIANQATLNAYKSNISAQITIINTAITVVSADGQSFAGTQAAWDGAIIAAQNVLSAAEVTGNQKISAASNAVDTAKQGLILAQKQLAEIKNPPRQEDVNLAQAQVSNAQAALDLANKQIDDSIIKSPIDGQVVKDNFNVGEQVGVAVTAFSVLAENDFEIDVDISESDIAKVKDNDPVEVTLDAFGSDQKFNATVFFIEPASTVIQDVIYYKVKIKFTETVDKLAGIKPGMTANVTIITDKKDNVLTVPERAVIEKENGVKIVRILAGGKVVEMPVKVGLRGDDGSVEILEGNIHEGDVVVVLLNTK
jgi:HlyD family secretion protein